jgi:23S rRNA pseudouridine955/2504/2580 synthase
MSGVQHREVTADDDGMRLDRWFARHFPQVGFARLQKLIRNGEVKVDKAKVQTSTRLVEGQTVRIPPVDDPDTVRPFRVNEEDVRFLKDLILYEDDDLYVFNKPHGLAVQGGSGTTRHMDDLLKNLPNKAGEAPRLVHRLDRDTSGCLVVAKTAAAAKHFGSVFRSRSARKIYWALVPGVPKPKQGRISTYLAKEERQDDSVMRVAKHGEEGASHAVTYYAVVETAAQRLAWLSLKPVTGRTHQLRVQLAHIGHPIVGDPKYFDIENWQLPGGMQNRLHLLARRIVVPHPRGGTIDATAPLPPHMQQSWSLIGLDATRYDPIEDAPEG